MPVMYKKHKVKDIRNYKGQKHVIDSIMNLLGLGENLDPDKDYTFDEQYEIKFKELVEVQEGERELDPEVIVDLPNFAFMGIGGIGKSNLIYLLSNIIGCEYIHYNTGTGERGKDFVNELAYKIQTPPTQSRIRFVHIEEASELTDDAQVSFRELCDKDEFDHNRYALSLNYEGKMDESLMDRFNRYYFRPLSTTPIEERLHDIAEEEGWMDANNSIRIIAQRAHGSMRTAIGKMQGSVENGVIRASIDESEESLAEIYERLKNLDISGAMQSYRTYIRYGHSPYDFPVRFMLFVENLTISKARKALIAIRIADLARDIKEALDTEVSIYGFFGNIIRIIRSDQF